jgi:hypothetical protein
MTEQQLVLLRNIIQEQIHLAIEYRKVERSFAIEEKCLDDLWQKFKDSFNGLK